MLDSVFAPSTNWEGEDEMAASAVWTPRMDLTETDDAYHLQMDLPGLSKSDIKIRMDDNHLMVSGERHEESTHEDEDSVHSERYFGSFYRSVQLPASIEEDQIEAHFRNGVLTVELPKSEASRPKHIEIN